MKSLSEEKVLSLKLSTPLLPLRITWKVSIPRSFGQDLVWSFKPIEVPGIKGLNRGKRLANTLGGPSTLF